MNRIGWAGTVLAAALFVFSSIPAKAQEFHARLSGFQEIGGLGASETGAILSTGEGTLNLTLDQTAQTLKYTLTYSFPSLPAGTEIQQSHIHFGKEHVAGNIIVFFCVNAPRTPPPTPAAIPPACPSPSGTVSGTLHPSDVVAVPASNVPGADFDALVAALTSNTAYVNIHTTTFPGGEIRGQIHRVDRDHHESGDKDARNDDDHSHDHR